MRGLFAALFALRAARTLLWLMMRPGGWALLVGGTIVALSATKGVHGN
jgi:hypothetical protein